LQQRSRAPVHDQFGNDQQRHRQEKADVHLRVLQKRHHDAAAHHLALERGQHQQRQPGDRSNDNDALPHHHQRVVGEVRPTQELKQRAAQDERELLRMREKISTAAEVRVAGFHRIPPFGRCSTCTHAAIDFEHIRGAFATRAPAPPCDHSVTDPYRRCLGARRASLFRECAGNSSGLAPEAGPAKDAP